MTNRQVTAELGGESRTIFLKDGTPQGGVLSPLIWNVVFDAFVEAANNLPGTRAPTFADDSLGIVTADNEILLEHRLNRLLRLAERWTSTVGLSIEFSKTDLVLFGKKPDGGLVVVFNNHYLPVSSSLKFLGVTFDSELLFDKHILDKVKAAKGNLSLLAAVKGPKWGPRPQLLKWAYETLVRPAVSYGSHIWAHRLRTSTRNQLGKLQRLALVCIAPVRNGTPTRTMELLFDILPIGLALEQSARGTVLRLPVQDSADLGPHCAHWTSANTKCGIDNSLIDRCNTTILTKRFGVLEPATPSGEGIEVYTDGSKSDQGVGLGFLIKAESHTIADFHEPLPHSCTVYSAEMLAINHAVTILSQMKFRNEQIKFFSDSMSSLLTLNGRKFRCRLAVDTIYKMNSLAKRNDVSLHWIRAHVGNEGNEEADQLAKSGAEAHGPSRFETLMSMSQAKSAIRTSVRDRWKHGWNLVPGHRQSKYWIVKPCDKRAKDLLKYDRQSVSAIVGFVSGFNQLNYHNHNIGRAETAECRLCEQGTEDARHLVEQCPAVYDLRTEHFGYGPQNGWTVSKLASFLKKPSIDRLLRNETNEELVSN
jgi:ribonuclease HI